MYIGRIASYTLVAMLAAPALAMAQQNYGRAFVSGTGTDSGICYRYAPCKTFAYAMTQVPAGGQVVAIDTADYGPVTIGKALTIAADPGVTAIIHGDGSADGVTVNAGASDVVNLRGLAMENVPTGVRINSGNVNLEHSAITGGTFGIIYASGGRTTVSDTTITGPSDTGILDQSDGSPLVLDRVSLAGSGNIALTASSLTMTDSTIVGWDTGLQLNGAAFVKRSVISGSGTGILVGRSTLYLDTTTITGCGAGVNNGGNASFNSYGNNNIVGNGTNIEGPKTTIQPQLGRPGVRRVTR